MPELPEVETVVRDLRPHLVGRKIIGAQVHWKKTIATPGAREFERAIGGHTIVAITRRAKYLIFHLHSVRNVRNIDVRNVRRNVPAASANATANIRYLLVHLRMTGGFQLDTLKTPRDKHMHVVLKLSGRSELRFRDPRKFGRMWLVNDPAQVVGKLGPEPLEIAARAFHALFEKRRGNLKPLLLDQTFIAGIGNIYADESLWYAKLHPLRRAESLTRDERGRLYRAIRQVLRRAIAVGGTSIDVMYKRVNGMSGGFQDSLRAFDREERPCRRCGTPIVKTIVGQRGTHFCPLCQTR